LSHRNAVLWVIFDRLLTAIGSLLSPPLAFCRALLELLFEKLSQFFSNHALRPESQTAQAQLTEIAVHTGETEKHLLERPMTSWCGASERTTLPYPIARFPAAVGVFRSKSNSSVNRKARENSK
jgi:hypothetical protein